MKSTILLVLIPALSFVSATSGRASFKRDEDAPFSPSRYIVEVDETNGLKRGLAPLHALYEEVSARKLSVKFSTEYNEPGIFTGAVVSLQNEFEVKMLQETPGVKAIRPIQTFQIPKLPKEHIVRGANDPEIPPLKDVLALGGVDKVHQEQNTGQGIKIGIIDTGIDYTHPAFGSTAFPSPRVVGGHDFVGDDYTGAPLSQPVPDADPMDCQGHGTHVAGIIAAQPGNEFGVTGVAFGAEISAYRVFGCAGSTSDDIIIEALIQGKRDGNHVLTMSLGDDIGWSRSTSALVTDRIAASGVIVTVAAGNAGATGAWYASSPGSADHAISIGSVDNTYIPAQNVTVEDGQYPPITLSSGKPLVGDGQPLEIFATSKDTKVVDDACEPLPEDTPDLSNYLVIVRRGTCPFVTKADNIFAKKGKLVFFYDDGRGVIPVDLDIPDFKTAMIRAEDGEYLVKQFAEGNKITISLPQVPIIFKLPSTNGGLMSNFSSYGPTWDFRFKPAVSAPGGNIMSTYPLKKGGWAVLSGTSMATPYVAGVAALFLKAKGTSPGPVLAVKQQLQTTSTKIAAAMDDKGTFQTLTKAGAGLVNAYNAIHANLVVSPSEIILNDKALFKGQHEITLINTGDEPKVYNLQHIPALTALSMKEGGLHASLGPVPIVDAPTTVEISHPQVTLAPKQSQKVTLVFKEPTADARYPLYSGFIDISSGSECYHVSYLGLAASLRDHQVIDTTLDVLEFQTPALYRRGKPLTDTDLATYTFADGDYPRLVYRLLTGSEVVRFDLVSKDIKFQPTIQKRLVHGASPWIKIAGAPSTPIIGILDLEEYLARNDENLSEGSLQNLAYNEISLLQNTFSNMTTIPNGEYRGLFRALKANGDRERDEDYESWLTPRFRIEVAP